jgi:hypothetical protein
MRLTAPNAIADPIISRVKKIAIHCSLVIHERLLSPVLCVSLVRTIDHVPDRSSAITDKNSTMAAYYRKSVYTYYSLVSLRVDFISLNWICCGMTRHSVSRGVLYTAPPSENDLKEKSEKPADD